jgi:hypothetical protein
MKDNPDLRWCKQQIRRIWADYDARVAAAAALPSGRTVAEPADASVHRNARKP